MLPVLALAACTSEPPATEPVARGAQLYRQLDCGSCHDSRPGGLIRRNAPSLEHVGTAAASRRPGLSAEEYLRESVESPGAYLVPGYPDVMPRGVARTLSESDLTALIAYLSSLK